jgi:hypothetical protein
MKVDQVLAAISALGPQATAAEIARECSLDERQTKRLLIEASRGGQARTRPGLVPAVWYRPVPAVARVDPAMLLRRYPHMQVTPPSRLLADDRPLLLRAAALTAAHADQGGWWRAASLAGMIGLSAPDCGRYLRRVQQRGLIDTIPRTGAALWRISAAGAVAVGATTAQELFARACATPAVLPAWTSFGPRRQALSFNRVYELLRSLEGHPVAVMSFESLDYPDPELWLLGTVVQVRRFEFDEAYARRNWRGRTGQDIVIYLDGDGDQTDTVRELRISRRSLRGAWIGDDPIDPDMSSLLLHRNGMTWAITLPSGTSQPWVLQRADAPASLPRATARF